MDAKVDLTGGVWLRLLAMVCGATLAIAPAASGRAAEGNLGASRNPCGRSGQWGNFKPLAEIQADIRIVGETLPADCSEGLFGATVPMSQLAVGRGDWSETSGYWEPTELFYHPLYFDETPLERYGQTRCPRLQPGLSGLHFFGTVALLPMELLADRPCRRISPLGYYRPGSCAPPTRERARFELDPLWFHNDAHLAACP